MFWKVLISFCKKTFTNEREILFNIKNVTNFYRGFVLGPIKFLVFITMVQLQTEYFYVLVFVFVSMILALILYTLSYTIAIRTDDAEKLSSYECGFESFDDARTTFDVRFYLIAILFIVFDLEAVYLFPWAVSLSQRNMEGFWVMVDFLLELGIGFWYAWRVGALEWE